MPSADDLVHQSAWFFHTSLPKPELCLRILLPCSGPPRRRHRRPTYLTRGNYPGSKPIPRQGTKADATQQRSSCDHDSEDNARWSPYTVEPGSIGSLTREVAALATSPEAGGRIDPIAIQGPRISTTNVLGVEFVTRLWRSWCLPWAWPCVWRAAASNSEPPVDGLKPFLTMDLAFALEV
eukprot:CAMPEP_0204116102 /NCGR_PEP_ID=MMETSP0361-20130328/5209_1 /ASSEMBLY_ACC=CAM_ASM_000343 /TAXON_ID=268821 /ORGANISM="Scrippsiella Hangoei, Strain SHTV-5" /LENGTH=179 /DNA_ID=CAMNT_0051066843 /DNA_START=215 /DNA_END=750 /DNA_ORIENTATION=+